MCQIRYLLLQIIDPPTQISFGGNSSLIPQDIAQSFTVSTTTPVSSLRVLIKKTGSPSSNITMRIVADNVSKPNKTTLTSGTISASTVTSTFNYITVPLSSTVSLTPGSTYWIVFDTANLNGPVYTLGANDAVFLGGQAKISTAGWSSANGGVWVAPATSTLDAYFDVYVGGSTGIIEGIIVGSTSTDTAWSFEVKDSTVTGTMYCQTGSGNNKTCDTSRAVPVQQALES
jgi:hypothetical protein